MIDLWGTEGDDLSAQLAVVLGMRSKDRRRFIAASDRCDTCQTVLWQVVDLPANRVLCTRLIEPGESWKKVRLDRRWGFVIVTGQPAKPDEMVSTACRCGWTDLRVADILARLPESE